MVHICDISEFGLCSDLRTEALSMAEKVKSEGSTESVASSTPQRKKRKWDQPAESIIAAAASTPGALAGMTLPFIFPSPMNIYPTMPTSTASVQGSLAFPTVQQNAAAIVQKINQDLVAKGLIPPSKIQDELIAREIVINDAEPGIRYKLTKRQTQEEIQAKTGAVVITRGRYKPPNGPADLEKPLYLHISAGTQLKDTAERIRAVDQAAALVDEMLRQGRQPPGSSSTGQLGTTSPMSAVVFVDFEADTSLDLISRIRGPNDQYINHIMNETGATVLLKGGACEGSCSEDIPQPLHLLISAEHAKSLDDARSLAEHLLETIRAEVVGSRPPHYTPPVSYNLQQLPSRIASTQEPGSAHSVSVPPQLLAIVSGLQFSSGIAPNLSAVDLQSRLGSCKNYSAVPPPKQLLTVDAGSGKIGSCLSSSLDATPALAVSASSGHPALPTAAPVNQFLTPQVHGIYPQASRGSESYPVYSAYSGLYPQASPLQQVALALQRPALSQSSVQLPSVPSESDITSTTQGQAEKQERQRRKFQEGPSSKREPLVHQGMPTKPSKHVGLLETAAAQLMPLPRSILASPPGSMLPPPPLSRSLPPPGSMLPPPPVSRPPLPPGPPSMARNTTDPNAYSVLSSNASFKASLKNSPPPAPPVGQVETPGLKLVEYGEDEDEEDDEADAKDELNGLDIKGSTPYANGKPFWAV